MKKDVVWSSYFEDEERFADFVNCFGCDGGLDLYGLLDFTDLPDALKNKVQNYSVNLIEIRKLSDEQLSELKTDLKQVLSFIKCSENKDALYRLIKSDAAYQTIDQEAFQVMSNYTHADQLIKQTEEHEEGERYNMCKAIDDLIEDGRMEGRMEGERMGRTAARVELIEKMLGKGKSAEDIGDLCDLELEEVQQVAEGMLSSR